MSAAVAVTGPRVWLLAARPATLPAAVVPVIVGTGSALHGTHTLNLPVFIPTLLAALLIQIGTNFANDVFDFRRGADTPERLGPLRVTQGGLVDAPAGARGNLCHLRPRAADRHLPGRDRRLADPGRSAWCACSRACCTPADPGRSATTAWATWCAF